MFAKNPSMQIRPALVKLAPQGQCFSHAEACRLAVEAMNHFARQVLIDLGKMEDATTAAFAQMVLLRRSLLSTGRDLCLTGLKARAAGVFEVNRLFGVLPTV